MTPGGVFSFATPIKLQSLSYDRGGLSGENLKRHILPMTQSVDVLKTAPPAPLPIPLPLVIRNVKLPAHRAGLPGKEFSFILCPLTPPTRRGLRGTFRSRFRRGDHFDPTGPETGELHHSHHLPFIFFPMSFTKAILSIFSAFVKGMASMNSILSGK